LGFPDAPHDDGPDAFEGGVSKVKIKQKRNANPPKMGGLRRNNLRNF
jgi:hypothetical protein